MTAYALYLHIPFCRRRCSYCDFNTYTTLGDLQADYVAALAREIELVGARGGRPPVHTLFFGGGTPSLLTLPQVAALLAAARAAFAVDAAAEITMEANPGTVDETYLAGVRALGVNRLSFGVQSALPGELALLGREHDFAAAVAAVDAARAAGFDNLNLDLIYGLPGQTVADWQRTLDAVLPIGVEHISLYCLTIEPGTPLQRALHHGTINAPDPDTAADQYEIACTALAAAGFDHYEISNWARPGRECRHNVVYWRNEPYLGLGAGAHGSAGGYRYQVVRQPRTYIRRMDGDPQPLTADARDSSPVTRHSSLATPFPLSPAVAAHHRVDDDEAMSDTAITQLRLLSEGLDLDGFALRFGRPFDEVYGDTVRQLVGWDLLRRRDGRLLLTDKGRFLSNQVFYRFV
ncbi:MAG: radical SAM family heme chaperone HemW [Anaerolineae bacterium]|uniref:radical SAM family heme chaperone HemW n=1 Tax=Promineifilum sp. TaxID=2664178 RepID=UPI001D9E9FB5|nr:radical SAM family heme chaperone HemW [Anaerolineales bacterium]MCB8934781.1 radical SAM family heme chaperone HemW [Promineifilum sp.]MCO5182071.1 radical SAM family heme chaperone HemW [Promineifilum sp.]MCW5847158.1 radical SAM family heme chaperone HemW [Anaerolineae bacterium]